jgi:hypothetical protein
MARRVEIQLLDDIDGTPAAETLRFALDGVDYEIDVHAGHASELRTSLEKYVRHARRLGRGHMVTSARTGLRLPVRSDRAQSQAIRDWARRKGIDLNDRGRIPQRVAQRFEAEVGR